VSYDEGANTILLNPDSDLLPDTTYEARLSGSTADTTGNALGEDYSWTFRTAPLADMAAPMVVSTVPLSNAQNVSQQVTVSATFDEPLETSTVTVNTFQLFLGASLVPASVSYTSATMTAILDPASALQPAATYEARLGSAITDLAGNGLVGGYTWTFMTSAAPDVTPPAGVSDLAVVDQDGTSLDIAWSAVGDDGLTGTPALYRIRYGTNMSATWDQLTSESTVSATLASGGQESATIGSLAQGTCYLLLVRAYDESGNEGPVSNSVTG
jgi:hypothetical protein